MDQEKVGKLIAALRKESGMTQEELGEKLNISQRSVSRWETGKNMPDISLLTPLAEALGISVTELLRGERLSEETITRREASEAVTALIGLAENKRRLRRVICAVIAAVVTLACMLALYNYEFSVSATSTAALESAINDYHFNDDMSAKVLRWTSVGSKMLVLYTQENHRTAGGLATLDRGIFGKYRIVAADNFTVPIELSQFSSGRRKYLAVCSVGSLKGASAFEVCSVISDPSGETRRDRVLYSHELDDGPFLTVFAIEDELISPFHSIRYLDAAGSEVSEHDILFRQNPPDQTAVRSGYGSADLGLIYVCEAILLLMGLVFVRYFLTDKR